MLIYIRNISIIVISVFIFGFSCKAVNEPSISASCAVIIDGETNEIIFQKNAFEKRSMASTTKIMTGLLAVESGRLAETVTVDKKVNIEGTAIGFNVGDSLTLKTLCYGLLLESGNDAAVLIAEFLCSNEKNFSTLMNKKAAEIGMNNTNFETASGLDGENHYTTAYDMALLGAYAVKNDIFCEICSTKTYRAEFISPDITRTFSNHNRLLSSCEGVFGIKTGFTKKSGRCLVTACNREGKTLVAVTLNAPDDWNDHKKLYDYSYSLYEKRHILPNIPQKVNVSGSDKKAVQISVDENPVFYVNKNSRITYSIYIPKNIYAPVEINDTIGRVRYYENNRLIGESAVISCENAALTSNSYEYKQSFWYRFKKYIIKFFN